MVSRIADALRRLPVLARPRRRRVRKPAARQNVRPHAPQPRPARVPYILTLSSRRIPRRSLAEAHVPYLRMSGRWLEEHGFVIGSAVQVVVEHGRVTLISEAAEDSRPVAVAE
jgi:toxic protein SymE